MKKYQKEIIGIYLIFIAVFILLSLFDYSIIDNDNNFMGPAGSYISNLLISFIGIGAFVIPIIFSILGYFYFTNKSSLSKNILDYLYYFLSISIWAPMLLSYYSNLGSNIILSHYSGFIGNLVVALFISKIGVVPSGLILLLSFLIIHMIFFDFSIYDLMLKINERLKSFYSLMTNRIKNFYYEKIKKEENSLEENTEISYNEDIQAREDHETNLDTKNLEEMNSESDLIESYIEDKEIEYNNESSDLNHEEIDSNIHIEEEVKEEEVDIDLEQERKKKYFRYTLPAANLLNDPIEVGSKYTESELHQKADELIYALETFGVKGKVRRINQGPVITLFEIEPDEGVRVNKFTNLSDDLSRVMKASKVRVIAPIPGTRFVGIEVPNDSPAIVYLKNIISSEEYNNLESKMTIALGKTTSGKSFSFELNKMPHLLVAGATGSGKSVCINAIIASILYKAKPDEVKFILIDPKKVELSSYNALKDYHLITTPKLDEDVITKTENSTGVLESAITEMERRFQIFSEVKVRNIDEYHKKCLSNSDLEKVPYIVIIIDELADLMMTSGRAIEDPITRLAQKARAIGIHLIVATQRPSVDVITGLIKSNFPARIAFQVSSKVDSRTIIDQGGAETLLGNGDMLFLPPGAATPVRLHGAYINLEEIESILSHITSQPCPEELFLPEIKVKSENENFNIDDRDELLIDAAKLVIQHQQASVSLLQRKFRIGYSRAGRIVDELEAMGIISGYSGSKARDVLVDESYLENIF